MTKLRQAREMNRERIFKRVDYETQLDKQVGLGDYVPEGHLARFIVRVMKRLDLGLNQK